MRNRLFLRLTMAAFFGGFLLLLSPGVRMFWQGMALIVVGFVTMAVWYWGIGSRRTRGERKEGGPTFSAEDPDVAALPPTSLTKFRDQLSRDRERQRRAQDG